MQSIIQIYTILWPYFWQGKKARYATLSTLFLIGLDIAAATYFPYSWQRIISPSSQKNSLSWFIIHTIFLFSTWLFLRSAPHLREIVFFPIINQAIKETRLKAIFKVHTISPKDLEKYSIQEIINATNRISQSIRLFMRASFIAIFPSFAKIISLSIALYTADIRCAGIIAGAYLGLLAALFFLRYYTQAKNKAWQVSDQVVTGVAKTLYNTTSIRFRPEANSLQLKKLFNIEAHTWQRYNVQFYVLHLIQDVIFYLGALICFVLLIISYTKGEVGLDRLILVYGLIASMHSPLTAITNNLKGFFGSMVDFSKTLAIFNLPSEEKPLLVASLTPEPIIIENVYFGYKPDKILLKNINLHIQPGNKIGISGPSGVGKSTLCQLIAGLLSASSGKIRYGNLPIEKINTASLGQVLCYLPQTNWMEDWSAIVYPENVKLQKQALSGGEYQKHMLEQALTHKPQIMILDETFNALDEVATEALLTTLLKQVPTVILVSHAKKLLSKMERIFTLEGGELIEASTSSLSHPNEQA
jgi:ABC-type bacteriocin/lantibiotic exporter with double-glycine peptidase domain